MSLPGRILFLMWGDLVITDVKLSRGLYFDIFNTDANLRSRQTFFTVSDTGSTMCKQGSHDHFRHFEYLIVAIAQILNEIWQFKISVYFGT